MLLYLVRHYARSNCVARPEQKVIIATILDSAAIPGVFCIGELESSANVRLELYDLLPSYIVHRCDSRASLERPDFHYHKTPIFNYTR